MVNGHPLMIPTNLLNALLALQTDPEVHKGLPIWVDAVCINQEDKTERGAQVNSMSTIYVNAEFVIVWLGIHNRHTVRVVEIIHQISMVYQKGNGESRRQLGIHTGDLSDQLWQHSLGLRGISVDEWYRVAVFMKKTWFERAWTLQEAALAQNAVCLCGSYSITMGGVSDLCQFMKKTYVDVASTKLLLERHPQVKNVANISDITHGITRIQFFLRDGFRKTSQFGGDILWLTGSSELHCGSVLLWLVRYNRSRQATDVRDKIFSLLGIIEQLGKRNNFPPCPLIADYSKTPAEICTLASRYILESTNCLRFLSLHREIGKTPLVDLPSWASDFTSTRTNSLIEVSRHVLKSYDADMSSQSQPWGISIDGNRLRLRGLKLGTIGECGRCIAQSMDLLSRCDTNCFYEGEEPAGLLCKTLSANCISKPCSNWAELAASFGWYPINYMSRKILESSSPEQVDSLYQKWLSQSFLGEAGTSDITPAVEDIQRYSRLPVSDFAAAMSQLKGKTRMFKEATQMVRQGRRVFRTDRGHIGLGPKAQVPNDCVWILSGSRLPFVLRQKDTNDDSRYELVGEAYVHGVMYGEAVKDLRPEDWKEIVIE